MRDAELLLSTFVRAHRRKRYLKLLATPKKRAKLRAALSHFRDLDLRYATALEPSDQNIDSIARILRSKHAPARCYLLASSLRLDDRELMLEEALDQVFGQGIGAFVSCIPGRLAYFESEEPGQRYILEFPSTNSA